MGNRSGRVLNPSPPSGLSHKFFAPSNEMYSEDLAPVSLSKNLRFCLSPSDPRGLGDSFPFKSSQLDIHINKTLYDYCSVADLCALSAASVELYKLATAEKLWMKLLRRDFPALAEIRMAKTIKASLIKLNSKQTGPHYGSSNINANNHENSDRMSNFSGISGLLESKEQKEVLSNQGNSCFEGLSSSEHSEILQAIARGNPAEAGKLATAAAERVKAIKDIENSTDIAILAAERRNFPSFPVIEWDSGLQSAKFCYEDERRRHYDPCLVSPASLALYFRSNSKIASGLTAMCRSPQPGTEMELLTRGLRTTWPDIELSCAQNFSYLRGFYFIWAGQKHLNKKINRQLLAKIPHLTGYTLGFCDKSAAPIFIANVDQSCEDKASVYRALLSQHWLADLFGGVENIRAVGWNSNSSYVDGELHQQ
jgi:hypothetical protein